MAVPKGYKFTKEQLANRKRKVKGKWSKKAKLMHSVRMKERWKAKHSTPMSTRIVTNGNALTITQRLDLIDAQVKAIREQM